MDILDCADERLRQILVNSFASAVTQSSLNLTFFHR